MRVLRGGIGKIPPFPPLPIIPAKAGIQVTGR